jgi:signal transduction histidine kinase
MLAERVEERTIELKRALLDKDAFLFAMSTEVNSPVTAILGFSELLKRLSKREDAHYRYVDQICRYAQIVSSRFQELMNVVSIEGQSNELNYELVDLEALCKEVLAEHQSDAERGGAVITMQFKLAVKSLWLDVPRVRLVVDKVIESALLKCNRSCSLKVVVGLDEGSQQLQFDFHHFLSTSQPVEELYGIPSAAYREDPIKLLNSENFDIEAMLVERAVGLLNGEITKEIPEAGQCRINIKLPLLQHPGRVI